MKSARRLSLVGALVALAACRPEAERTGLVVLFTNEYDVPGEIDLLRVIVTDLPGGTARSTDFPLAGPDAHGLPARMLLLPASGSTGRLRVEARGVRVAAAGRPEQVLVARSATVAFVPDRVVELSLPLRRVCRAKTTCGAGETCGDQGVCGNDEVTGLPPYDRTSPTSPTERADASAPTDGAAD
jgi:hypothetical protein